MDKTEKVGGVSSIIKGVATSVIVTLVGVLIFAGVVKLTFLGQSIIKTVNQFIKILSIFFGCFFCVSGKNGLIKGAIIGVLSMVITYLLFALIGGEISFGKPFFLDLVFGLIVGGISGIIAVNVKK